MNRWSGFRKRVSGPLRRRLPLQAASRWVAKGETVSIQGLGVSGGLFYLGTDLRLTSIQDNEPSLINPQLPIASDEGDVVVVRVAPRPSYLRLPPDGRRAHLEWLNGPREIDVRRLDSLLLYFYGLERRLLLDRIAPDEEVFLCEEVVRIHSGLDESHRLYGAATKLLEALWHTRTPFARREMYYASSGAFETEIGVLARWYRQISRESV